MSVGEPSPAPAQASGRGRPAASGPQPPQSFRPAQPALLEAVVAGALDPAYADAAERRRDRPPRARSATVSLLVVGGLALGLVLSRERLAAPSAEDARSALVGDARARTATVDQLSDQVNALRRETNALQASVLDTSREGRALAQRTADLGAATGATAVTGPGIEVSVDDAPDAGQGTGSSERRPDGQVIAGRVSDRDLQEVVNALWAAGAEAVSVGGIRLSPTTAIRTAGQTILADYRPLTAPYVISVVGDRATLERRFRAAGAPVLERLRQSGALVRITPRDDLHLPASTATQSRVARPLVEPSSAGGSSGSSSSGSSSSGPSNSRPQHARFHRHDGSSSVIAALALLAGLVAGLFLQPTAPDWLEPYLPIAVVAALDAVFGAVRARLEGIFDDKVFVVSFVSNVLVAALVVYLGDNLGVGGQLSTAVVVVLGIRIFSNAAAIRRRLFRA